MDFFKQRSGKSTPTIVYGFVIILIGFGYVVFFQPQLLGLKQSTSGTGTGTGTSASGCAAGYVPPPGWLCTQLPLQFSVQDLLASSSNAINSATVALIRPSSLSTAEAPTTASTGIATTANSYNTGQLFDLKLSATNYVTEYPTQVIPPVSTSANQVTVIVVPEYMVKTGSFSITATVTGGTTWSSTFASYSFAATGLSQIIASFTITESNNNQGWLNSYDPINHLNQMVVADFADGGSGTVTANGYQFFDKVGTTSHWMYVLPDGLSTVTNSAWTSGQNAITQVLPADSTGRYQSTSPANQVISINQVSASGSLSQQLQGNNAIGGSATFQITFNKGSLSGAGMTVTLTLEDYADPVFHATFGNFGPNAASLGTLSILLHN